MWPFDRLKIRFKLTLLAGVPVLGALALSALIALDAQDRTRAAAGLGSIEDLAQLTSRMTRVVHGLQVERASFAYAVGRDDRADPRLLEVEQKTNQALQALEAFLAGRDKAKLPSKLRQNLEVARKELQHLGAVRAKAGSEDFQIEEFIGFYARANDGLINATSGLMALSDDGDLLRSISRLVGAMQVLERSSREHALLSYVFAKKEFPPGTFRYFVTLLTEQDVYAASLRAFGAEDELQRVHAILQGPRASRAQAMRKHALETTDEELSVEARDWFDAQGATTDSLRRVESDLSDTVRAAAARKVAETRSAVRVGLGLAIAVVLSSILLGAAIARGITRSVRVLSEAAEAVQRDGNFQIRARKTSNDELGVLTTAFNVMLAGLEARDHELTTHRENLEALVEVRTQELSRRNEQMRLVLDNVEQGLVMIDRDGKLLAECSKAFTKSFGIPVQGQPFSQLLAGGDENSSLTLELAYEQLISDVLPLEAAIGQMPKRIAREGRQYALSFTAVLHEGSIDGALLAARDITEELAVRHAELLQREQIKTFQRIMRDRFGFVEFFTEARALVERVRENAFGSATEKMRAIHTLKGNAAIFDVGSLSNAAHQLEQALVEEEPKEIARAVQSLLERWLEFAAYVTPVLGQYVGERVEITHEALDELLALARTHQPYSSIEGALARLLDEPMRVRFERMREQLEALAPRLGKPQPEVLIDAGDVRIPVARFREFWGSLAHVVRNVVDHGLQTEGERLGAGKSAINRIELRASSDTESLIIEIADDGRGIDWDAVASRARQKQLPHQGREELVRALFRDGVSTALDVTESSGRGVGLSAVLQACEDLGGRIQVESELGQGTRLRFIFPPETAQPTGSDSRSDTANEDSAHVNDGCFHPNSNVA